MDHESGALEEFLKRIKAYQPEERQINDRERFVEIAEVVIEVSSSDKYNKYTAPVELDLLALFYEKCNGDLLVLDAMILTYQDLRDDPIESSQVNWNELFFDQDGSKTQECSYCHRADRPNYNQYPLPEVTF